MLSDSVETAGDWVSATAGRRFEEDRDRAAVIVRLLFDARLPNMGPELRGFLTMGLATDEGRRAAHAQVLREYGYVSRHPVAFVRLQVNRDRYPSGLPSDGV